MKLDSIRTLSVVAFVIACAAIAAGCRSDGAAVDSDSQGLRGWKADGGDGRGHFGGRGDYGDDDADGGSDERGCRDRWLRGIGDHDGHDHENEDDDGNWNGWDGRR